MSRARAHEPARDPALRADPEEHPIDPVPDHVREAARRAFAVRDRHAEVLALVTDSLVDGADDAGPRRLAFVGAGLPGQVLVTVLEDVDAQQVSLVVECPWPDGRVEEVVCGDTPAPLAPQGPGRWVAGPVEHGLFRAGLRKDGVALHTAWVRV